MQKKQIKILRNKRAGLSSMSSSLIAIMAGIFAGFIILLISNPKNALEGFLVLIKGGFSGTMKDIGDTFYFATPIIMTGLSVGFAFKTGMFNIGATGQLLVGGLVSIWVGATWSFLPPSIHWVVALIMGMLGGALWGMIVGLLKALLNVHEVISSIMLNYIGLFGVNYIVKISSLYDPAKTQTVNVLDGAVIPKAGLDDLFFFMRGKFKSISSVNAGIFIAIFFAIVIYILLNKTAFGYELKACGYNRFASKYAGINENKTIIYSMTIAGALSGVAGALMYLAPATGLHIEPVDVLVTQGFNGIAVALLGLSNPIGIIFSGIFVAHIGMAGKYLQSLNYMKEIIDVIIGMIIYFSAFSLAIKELIIKLIKKTKKAKEAKK